MNSMLLDNPMVPVDALSPAYSALDLDERFTAAAGERAYKLSHSLAQQECLSLQGLASLTRMLDPASVRCLDENRLPVEPGESASSCRDYADIVRNIADNQNWMVLRNVEQVPAYAELLDALLRPLGHWLPDSEGSLTSHEGVIHLLAPGAETPAHIAPQHNLLMQVSGSTRIFIAPFPDRHTQLREIERYCDSGQRYLSHVPPLLRSFRLHAGQALYLPPWLPRWVVNDGATSISVNLKFRSSNSERFECANLVNSELRSLGLTPTEAGQSQLVDMTKSSYLHIRRRLQALVSQEP